MMEMFSQNEIMLMIGVVSVLLICITILTILDIKDYLKEKKGVILDDVSFGDEYQEKEEIITSPIEVVESHEMPIADEILISSIEDDKQDEVLLEEIEDDNVLNEEITMQNENLSMEEIVPQVEINTVTNQEPQKKEKKKLEIFENLDEIENQLPNNKDDITNFEMEQERTAIISLDELLKQSEELYDSNEVMQYDDGNEPISIDEVLSRFKNETEQIDTVTETKEVPELMQVIEKEKVEPYSRKETIPFISSVYGIEKKNQALEFENTATYEKLDRENYNDFVAKLREMNENK